MNWDIFLFIKENITSIDKRLTVRLERMDFSQYSQGDNVVATNNKTGIDHNDVNANLIDFVPSETTSTISYSDGSRINVHERSSDTIYDEQQTILHFCRINWKNRKSRMHAIQQSLMCTIMVQSTWYTGMFIMRLAPLSSLMLQ